MVGREWLGWACVVLLTIAGRCGLAQSLPTTQDDALRELLSRADIAFAGHVTAVRHVVAPGGADGVVEIDFAVDDSLRGVTGTSYTLREWGGLWTGGAAPFRVGQYFFMLLHAPNASGLSSPVGGSNGAIPIRGVGPAAMAGQMDPGVQVDSRVVDLSWVGTGVVRTISYSKTIAARPITVHAAVVSPNAVVAQEVASSIATVERTTGARATVPYTEALGWLRAWEKSDHPAR